MTGGHVGDSRTLKHLKLICTICVKNGFHLLKVEEADGKQQTFSRKKSLTREMSAKRKRKFN